MTTIQSATHDPTSIFYPGSHGDRPTPWQRVYMCTCGEELGFDEEGAGSADPETAYEEHIRDTKETPS